MNKRRSLVVVSILGICILLVSGVSLARGSTNFNINPVVLASGGGLMGSANHALDATIGQMAPGFSFSTQYRLAGAFWEEGGRGGQIYLPIILRQFR